MTTGEREQAELCDSGSSIAKQEQNYFDDSNVERLPAKRAANKGNMGGD